MEQVKLYKVTYWWGKESRDDPKGVEAKTYCHWYAEDDLTDSYFLYLSHNGQYYPTFNIPRFALIMVEEVK